MVRFKTSTANFKRCCLLYLTEQFEICAKFDRGLLQLKNSQSLATVLRLLIVYFNVHVFFIFESGEEHFEECLKLVIEHSLYTEALALFPTQSTEYKVGLFLNV